MAASLLVGLLNAGAIASPPNLTGSWFNPNETGSPRSAYQLVASSDLSTLTATYTGGAGHTGLRGRFSGTLNSDETAYVGTVAITEAGSTAHDSMTFTIDSPDHITVSYQSPNGGAGTFTLARTAVHAIKFSFRGYSNNVKVAPPLIGLYQLTVARINGSGTVSSSGSQGEIDDSNQPNNSSSAPNSMRAAVTGYSYSRAAHGKSTTLTLSIQITLTNAPRCEVGDRGSLTLYESAHKLSNGQRSDHILMSWDGGRCPEYVQGWTNADGGARTSPHFGGPPHGGQWAIVKISA